MYWLFNEGLTASLKFIYLFPWEVHYMIRSRDIRKHPQNWFHVWFQFQFISNFGIVNNMMFGFKHNFWITEGHIFIFIGVFFLGCVKVTIKKIPKEIPFSKWRGWCQICQKITLIYTHYLHNAIFMEQIDQYPLSVAISWVSCVNIK